MVVYPNPHRLTAEIEIKDEFGNVEQTISAKSFTQHLINLLFVQSSQTTLATQLDTGGVSRSIVIQSSPFNILALVNDATYGIQAGTGSTAVAVTDTKLQTLIAHGVGAGQLSYGNTTIIPPTTVGNDRYFEIARVLTNSSGSDITVNEIGLVEFRSFNFLFERTVTTFTITNGGNKTITYRLKITV